MKRTAVYLSLILVLAVGLSTLAQEGLHIFVPGEPIIADEVNHNFEYLQNRIEADAVSTFFGGTESKTLSAGEGADCSLGDVWLTASIGVAGGTPARGQLVDIRQNEALYTLLGTTYGGDGKTTFALPDLSRVAPRSANGQALSYVICTHGIFPRRNE